MAALPVLICWCQQNTRGRDTCRIFSYSPKDRPPKPKALEAVMCVRAWSLLLIHTELCFLHGRPKERWAQLVLLPPSTKPLTAFRKDWLHDLINSSMPHLVITLNRVNDIWRFECVQTTSNHGGVGPWHLHRPQINPAFQVWFLSLVRVIIPCSMQPHGFSHRKLSLPESLYHTFPLAKASSVLPHDHFLVQLPAHHEGDCYYWHMPHYIPQLGLELVILLWLPEC